MKDNLFIITNESIYRDQNGDYLCDNIDLKSIPEGLNNFSDVTVVGRNSSKKRSKKINLERISASKNIFTYLKVVYKSFQKTNTNYLIISLSPFTFLASIMLKLFSKKHFLYFRSDGYEEYRAILGFLGPFIYNFMFKIGIKNAHLISCRKHLLRERKGDIVNPSQLNEKWFQGIKKFNPSNIKLLYIGRLRVEKGIFSLVSLLRGSKINLTIITSEKGNKLKGEYKNIKHISFENYNDAIIKIYD